jgi:hypothetical protein
MANSPSLAFAQLLAESEARVLTEKETRVMIELAPMVEAYESPGCTGQSRTT